MDPRALKWSKAAALLALVATVGGCSWLRSMGIGKDDEQSADPVATSQPSYTTTQQSQTLSMGLPSTLQPVERPVAEGPLPQIYVIESPGQVRVSNTDTGEEIIVVPVKPGQILRVEPRGVLLENEPVMAGSLAPGNYAITPVLGEGAGKVRTTNERVQPTTKPTPPPQ